MTDKKWSEPKGKPKESSKNVYILPLGKNTYSFCSANNRVDAWNIFERQVPRSQISGMSYKDVMTSNDYFKSRPKTYYSKQLKRHVTIPED